MWYFIRTLLALLASSSSLFVFAQEKYSISGKILSQDKKPLANITVTIESLDQTTTTNEKGGFSFRNLPGGEYVLQLTAVGFVSAQKLVRVPVTAPLEIILLSRMVGLKEVIVTARPKVLGSSSLIERSAILHTQPTSLADVLQLVPGQLASNPNLGIAQQVNLRQVPSTTDAARANALGTQIVLDGVPLSNNANMQTNLTILNSGPSSLPPFSSVAGRGADLRQIPADNIESIEVIRGIPSARFGDLTAGLVVVQSRIGAFRPEMRVRLNPTLTQAAVAAGVTDKVKRNTINVNADILSARDDIRDNFNRYTRAQGQFAWQRFWNRRRTFSTTTIVSGYKTLDALKQDPDDLRNQSRQYSDEWGFKASTEGRLRSKKENGFSFHYIGAVTYNRQIGYFQSLVTRDLFPISTAYKDTTLAGQYGRSEYLNKTTLDGRPLNAYARVEVNWVKLFMGVRHRFTAGGEWRMDSNNGKGRQFDLLTPPRQNYSVGERPQSFSRIPALHQVGYYLEDRISGKLFNKSFMLQAGIRLDNVSPTGIFNSRYKTILSPRINAGFEVSKGIWVRGGYGVAAKAPTLNFLYPGTRYFDLVGFNYFAANPAERLVVITTRTINLDDQPINPYTAEKWEMGLDLNKKSWKLALAAFIETTTGAVGFNREVKPVTFPVFQAQSFPSNRPPVLDPTPARIDTFFAAFDQPVNNRFIQNKGIEYSIDLPELSSILTSFNITGAYIHTESYDDGRFTDADRAVFSSVAPNRVGIYNTANRVVATRLNSSVRVVHRIPQLNMVVSGLWQVIWLNTTKPQNPEKYPVAYIDRQGQITELNETESKQPEYADLVRTALESFKLSYPPLHLYSIRLTKEWRRGFSFSFFANNFLNHRPSRKIATSPTTTVVVRRNEPIFFGAEFNLSF